MYAKLPFLSSSATAMSKELLRGTGQILFSNQPQSIFSKEFFYRFIFKHHYPSDMLVRSSVIYKYTCDCYQQSYIGNTALQLLRCAQHRGVSFRTGDRLSRQDNSAIRDPCFNNGHPFKISNFNVVDSTSLLLNLRIL